MIPETFKAMIVEQTEPKKFSRTIGEKAMADLPEGDLLVKVHYSSLNFKDALSATGNPGVTRKFPHTPGIDAAGEVVQCDSGAFAVGDQVIVTSYDLGMNTAGGYGEYIRVPSKWALKLPQGLTLRESMIYGTAGLTAALSVLRLEQGGVKPEDGDILVNGATGGVGSIAVSILAKAGYRVVAATGKPEQAQFLTDLGAAEIISREEVVKGSERPMMKERWAGVIDVAGGEPLAAAIKSTRYGGVVTCCGLVASMELNLNVFPFILRGVSLIGIDSAECPMSYRTQTWARLAGDWKLDNLEETVTEVTLEGLEEKIFAILKGQVSGRTLVNLQS
ncbi:MAG: YhdH/YhfP family quinone oxidoreductase [Desulfuromonas sp.]|nr:YhdH/YhfP family quinone oxidoreductase [Desulfuromonas sp.]